MNIDDPKPEKRKHWVTAFGFMDFAYPVTEAEANAEADKILKIMTEQKKDNTHGQ